MNTYLIYMPAEAGKVAEAFPDAHHQIAPELWAIGSPLATPADVCEKLGIDEGAGRSMIVARMGSYYGRFDPGLWQRLDAWEDE